MSQGKPSGSAAAVVLVSKAFLQSHPYLKKSAAAISGCTIKTRMHSQSPRKHIKSITTRTATQEIFRKAHVGPRDIQIVELQDYSGTDPAYALDDLGLTESGQVWKVISEDGGLTYAADKAGPKPDVPPRDKHAENSGEKPNFGDKVVGTAGLTELCKIGKYFFLPKGFSSYLSNSSLRLSLATSRLGR